MDKKLRILHLEDSLSDAELVCKTLREGGIDFEIHRIDTKDKFSEALIQFMPDIIFSTHSLPFFHPFEAIAILKDAKIETPFIMITSNRSVEFAVESMRRGADDYILKDNQQRLPGAIDHVLDKYHLKKEHQSVTDNLILNEKRFLALIKNGDGGMTILSRNGKPVFYTLQKETILGYSDEDMAHFNLFNLVHPDDVLIFKKIMSQVHDNPGMQVKTDGIRILHKNGNWLWIEGSLTNMQYDSDINGIVVNFRNITDRKLAEEQVLTNERKYRRLIENSSDAIVILSAEGKPTYISPSLERVTGYSYEESLNINLLSLVHPDTASVLLSALEQTLASPGIPIICKTIKMRHKDNSWRWMEGIFTNLLDDPDINGIVDNFWDITERIQAELILKESEEKYRMFFENSIDGILLTQTDGKIFAANLAACQIFQMTEMEICAAGRSGLLDYSDLRVSQGIKDRQLNGKARQEITLIRKDGSKLPAEVSSAVYVDSQGNERTTTIVRDISEKKLAEKSIIHVNRLYAFISHINQAIVHTADDQTLFNETCKIAVDHGKFKMAWIGLIDTDTQKIKAVASYGASVAELNIFKDYAYDISGPIEKVIHGQNFYVVNDLIHEQKRKWNIIAKENGYKSAIVLALKKMDKVIGTLNIYSTEADFFNEEEVKLLTGASGDICFALEVFEKDRLRSEAEQNLSQIKSKLLIAQRIARLCYWEVNLTDHAVFWTDEIYSILGREKESFKLSLESFIQVIHPEDKEMRLLEHSAAWSGLKDLNIEYRILLPDGSIKWVQEQGTLKRNEQGVATVFKGTVQDIDKIKKSELEILKIYEERNIILESIGDAFFAVNTNWEVNYWNKEAERLLDCPRDLIINKNLWDVFSRDLYNQSYDYYLKAFEENAIQHFESFYNITGKWLEITVYPSSNGLSIYFTDITERKLADLRSIELNNELQTYTRELLISHKELEQFSYILSHNLRAPVANIMGITEELKDPTHTEDTKEMLNAALSTCIHLLNDVIIDLNAILTVKKVTSEKRKKVLLSDLIADIQTSIYNLIQAEHVQISVDFNDLNEIFTLKSYLYSIFFNLISNSIKYHQPGIPPVITIKSEISGKYFIITFKDNGMGIDLVKYKNQIFGLYKRFHLQIEGKGMGLFMVKTQVEALKGKIVIYSNVNEGAEFVMTFPMEN